jgi:hypothetical protein
MSTHIPKTDRERRAERNLAVLVAVIVFDFMICLIVSDKGSGVSIPLFIATTLHIPSLAVCGFLRRHAPTARAGAAAVISAVVSLLFVAALAAMVMVDLVVIFIAPWMCLVFSILGPAIIYRKLAKEPVVPPLTCAACGYSLKGLTSPTCPECGTPQSSVKPKA